MPNELYRGSWFAATKRLRAIWTLDPNTICWRDGKLLHEHPAHKTGKPARWTAGHIDDWPLLRANGLEHLVIYIDGVPIAAEASVDNFREGAIKGNDMQRRRRSPLPLPSSRNWHKP
jgi:hypothetical protein